MVSRVRVTSRIPSLPLFHCPSAPAIAVLRPSAHWSYTAPQPIPFPRVRPLPRAMLGAPSPSPSTAAAAAQEEASATASEAQCLTKEHQITWYAALARAQQAEGEAATATRARDATLVRTATE